ncbi:MAG: transposase [Rhodococcus sp. (in: high G+C Gram-positive bacteria)]
MARERRSFTTEYKVEAAHRVIDSGRSIAEVARELGLGETLLGKWVADERRRVEAAASAGEVPLTPAERAELVRLRRQVSEQDKDIAFLKKRPRTSPRINTSRALRVDERGVRDYSVDQDGTVAGGVDLRILRSQETQRCNGTHRSAATSGRHGHQDSGESPAIARGVRVAADHRRSAGGRGVGDGEVRSRAHVVAR